MYKFWDINIISAFLLHKHYNCTLFVVAIMSEVERQAQKFVGKVVSGGRVTIPKRIREILTIQEGSLIECEIYKFQR